MIKGRLVNLRGVELDDLDRDVRWVNDTEVTRHLNMRYPLSRSAEEEWLKGVAVRPGSYESINFAIETKDGIHIGNLGFHEVHPEDRKARLGIMIGDKDYWSKGYGTDAMLTFLRFAFDEMNLHRVDLTVDAENERALACYRKCGFVEEARLRQERYSSGRYFDQLVMGILRGEFYAAHGVAGEVER
jgi:RimJ/RimL family protein N-acetyltransferase